MENLIYRVNRKTKKFILNEIADIVYEQWPDSYQHQKKFSLEELNICQRRYEIGIPQCVYALKDEKEVVGVAYLLDQDTDFFTKETPWLANVFVKPQVRNKGLGKILVTNVIVSVKILGFENIFLHTIDKQRWYQTLGFHFYRHFETEKNNLYVMKMSLA